MSNCNKRCPVVKQQLRKLVTESPWVLKEIANGDVRAASLLQTVHDRHYDRRSKDPGRKASNGKRISATQTPIDTRRTSKKEKEAKIHDRSVLERRIRTSATQWSDAKEEFVKPVETDVSKPPTLVYTIDSKGELLEQDRIDTAARVDKANGTGKIEGVDKIDRANGTDRMHKETIKEEADTELQADGMDRLDRSDDLDAKDQLNGTGEIDKVKKMDKEVLKQDVTEETAELAMFRDECEPSCPRRLSRKSRIRKLEERQRIIDAYLLNKGSRYFEDVCTCSLSCVLRALKRDSFVTSTLASIVLFTLGVKLCSELNAWYLPIRFS